MTTILIAEDEAGITFFLEKGLRASGFETEVAGDGEEALRLARTGRHALLVLDLGLPGLDGIDVLRTLRGEGRSLPVVILTARQAVDDLVLGLDGGANDYVTKPFRLDELIARIRLRLRDEIAVEPALLRAGDATLDLRARRVHVADRWVALSAREHDLARVLFRRAGHVVTRAELLREVWGSDVDSASNVIEVYVGYLRRKLGRERITSVRRVGYRLESPAATPAGPPQLRSGRA